MSFSRHHNIGGYVGAKRASDNVAVTAGGAGDNTQVVGQIIDRQALSLPLSILVLILWKTVLAAAATLTLKSVLIEHGDDSALADAATYATLETAGGTAVATSAGGGTVRGESKYSVDLNGAKRYIRIKYTPDLSAANTDTAELSSCFVTGGSDTL